MARPSFESLIFHPVSCSSPEDITRLLADVGQSCRRPRCSTSGRPGPSSFDGGVGGPDGGHVGLVGSWHQAAEAEAEPRTCPWGLSGCTKTGKPAGEADATEACVREQAEGRRDRRGDGEGALPAPPQRP